MRTNRLLIAGTASAMTLASGGCALLAVGAIAAAAAVGTNAYINGKLESTEHATLAQTYDAALAAVEALEFDLKKHGKDALEARVLSERVNGDTVTIRLFSEGDGQTRIAIRVGALGDEDVSKRLLKEIQSRLPEQEVASGGDSNAENSAAFASDEASEDEIAAADESDHES